ncbi:MAG: toll/interleukin-1 receptor domain-containing protein [Synergistaceae bacterium]|jgi:hypothetical protein|nr:toll/interleukin-1 receptor domain-containing protein [Synergistaceae bacterium]
MSAASRDVGDGPFLFVSYAHEDVRFVTTVIDGIVSGGYKVWYDKNIDVSTIWSDEIANAILACRVFVVFVTRASMASSFVRSEVEFALDKKVTVIPVYLEGMDVMPPGLSLMLHSTQGIEGNDPGVIVFRICKWLMQNQGGKDAPRRTLLSRAAKKTGGARNDREEDEGEGNFWGSGLHGNTEEYSQYLKIKNGLDGDSAGGSRKSSYRSGIPTLSFPLLKWAMRLVLLVGATEILRASLVSLHSGFQTSFFTETLLYWGLPLIVFKWYFSWRYSGQESLFAFLPKPRLFQFLLYWCVLLGWLLMNLNLDSFKAWGVLAGWVLAWFPSWFPSWVSFDYRVIEALTLPLAPEWLQTGGLYAAVGGGALLIIDMIGAFLRSNLIGR